MKYLYLTLAVIIVACISLKPPITIITPIPVAIPNIPKDSIKAIASISQCASYSWKNRGQGPIGFFKGMALSYAHNLCLMSETDSSSLLMAQAQTGNDNIDALSWYNSNFKALAMDNEISGANTLKHLYVLGIGLAMRESSGNYCEGNDVTAGPEDANNAEAGLFQTSYDSHIASKELVKTIVSYSKDRAYCYLDAFTEGASCPNQSIVGAGPGADFQILSKKCPGFAVSYAMVGMRVLRKHWGPLVRKEAEIRPECDDMLNEIEQLIISNPSICSQL